MRRQKAWGRLFWIGLIGLCVFGLLGREAAAIEVDPDEEVNLGPFTLGPGQTLGPLEVVLSVSATVDNETTFTVDNETTFVASCNAPWVALEPASGAIPGVIKAKVTISALMEGSFNAEVTVTSNKGQSDAVKINVTVRRLIGEPLTLSPNFVDLGTIRLLGGESYGPVGFTVSISGGPIPSEGKQATFQAASDQPWLQAVPSSGNVPGTTTVQVTISDRMVGSFQGTVTITTSTPTPEGGTITASGTVIVTLTVERAIGDLLIVSPSTLDVEFTTNNLTPQVFPLDIRNADPEGMVPTWSAEAQVPWLRVDPASGTGNTVATLTVDPRLVPLTSSVSSVEGTIVFRSNLVSEPVTVTVRLTVVVVSNERISVYPSYLYWNIVRSSDGTLESFSEEILTVASQNDGWIVWTDAPFVTLTSLDGLVGGAQLMGSGVGTRLSVMPSAQVLAGYGYGRYEGRIMVSNLPGDAMRIVPVIVEIRRPEDPITPPIPPNTFLQSVPGYVLVEAVDTVWFEMLLSPPETVNQYASKEACLAAGGVWMDPDNVPGTLDETCSLDQKVYVLAAVPDAIPGRVYVLSAHHPAGLTEAYLNGVKLPGADQWYYSAGPVPYIPIGPMQLLGLYGRVHVSVRVGCDLASAQEVQRVQINVRTVEGSWLITENYQGSSYSYGPSRPLTLARQSAGSAVYVGSWDGASVTCSPGDGVRQLYLLEFTENGVRYVYEIQSLTANKMKGRWMFSTSGITSQWETFEGSRLTFVP